jgi:RND family efflux transporter MFP subunit
MTRAAKLLLPVGILGLGIALVAVLYVTRPKVVTHEVEIPLPTVRVVTATRAPVQFTVETQGTVVPRTQSELVPQVSGEVTWVSPSLVSGGFFEKGQPLLRVDRLDYEADLESARASVARVESEAKRAAKELARQGRLADRSVASQARIDDAENADRVAQASLREAQARLGRALRDVERTELRAPYDGRVRSENVDPGQFVQRGAPLAMLYAVDYAEVRLPVPDRELRYLNLPLTARDSLTPAVPVGAEPAPASGPRVALTAEFAGEEHVWTGRIVRTEGEIDAKSRMVTVVAQVDDPYGRDTQSDRAPLAVGLFVKAEIEGTRVAEAFVLPRTALYEDRSVLVVDADDRLRIRPVEILRRAHTEIVVGGGLDSGERVSISAMPGAVDGMRVRAAEETPTLARTGS